MNRHGHRSESLLVRMHERREYQVVDTSGGADNTASGSIGKFKIFDMATQKLGSESYASVVAAEVDI
ncbi:hypothetical protein BOTBODRAFT_237318 [Botryobasidium botryosum FD-172 SS1]|uniref:Uncharacterized protein n=1 Tax=Botryobasidium botryosum (strain FD-172 SS1) TaxID=930990 RepID=A0A067MPM5_BOTB1|nr:hypothetical protein BOTBODRAFT_237318 [Botryobasidium botryosum FD-172 SS1]